jgi:hypothetical protein
MDTRLIEACAYALECYLEMLFENPVKIPNTGMAEIPIVGGPYILDLEDRSQFFPMIVAALAARERFRQEAPEGPILPLREDACAAMMDDDRPRLQAVGLYGDSWRYAGWDKRHPRFYRFCSGLMAYESTPDHIRNDSGLRREFPPRELAGLCDGWLVWRSKAAIDFDRQHRAWCEGTGPAPVKL